MARWGVLGGVLGAVALSTLAGCGTRVGGAAIPQPDALTPITVAQFGVARTVDPCSLVDINQLPVALSGYLEPADGLDDCPVSVTLPGATLTDVRVGPLETQPEETDMSLRRVASLPRYMTLYTATDNVPGFCDDYLTFSDGVSLVITANAADPSSRADTCPAAEALGRNAAAQIAQGDIRHVTFPPGSVGSIDPCHLVSGNTLARAGIPDAQSFEYPENHQCWWLPPSSDSNGDSMYLEFLVGEQPSVVDQSTDSSSQIAGRNTVDSKFSVSSTSAWCDVSTGLNTYGGGTDNLVEIAMVEMHTGDGNPTNACNLGNGVAAEVWPQLPKTG
jgi:hypothetical protein